MPRRLLLLALALVALPVAAQAPRTADLVDWRVQSFPAAPGEATRLVLDVEIAPGWRLYALDSPVGIPLVVSLDPLPEGVAAGALTQSDPEEAYDPAFQQDYTYFAESGRVTQRLRVGRRAAAGRYEVSGALRFAVCDDRICLPPTTQTFRVPLVVEAGR